MNNIILHDSRARNGLLPLVFTKPVALIRIGILTIKEKYEKRFSNAKVSFATQDYLLAQFPVEIQNNNVLINACFCVNEALKNEIEQLPLNTLLVKNDVWICIKLQKQACEECINTLDFTIYPKVMSLANTTYINRTFHIFANNAIELVNDFNLVTKGRTSMPISTTNNVINPTHIFLEEEVSMEYATLNASTGPIYLGKQSEVMEGSVIRGAFALGEYATLKLATKIYGATTIGPHCKVGGEVNNSVIFGFSNKAHDGFIGNAVIGEWCNLGADTNNSNLKNNYGNVKLYNYDSEQQEDTQLQFCGLIMGDHSKCGINTMFNTGTVVGVSANVFGAGFPHTFIPSFTWGGIGNSAIFKIDKAIELADKVYQRRNLLLSATEKQVLSYIYENTTHKLNEYS